MTDLDEVLERFQMGSLEYGPGLSNHGPMVAEALVALGHPALLTGVVDGYAPRLRPFRPGEPLSVADRAAALGDPLQFAGWVATWESELLQGDWREVVRTASKTLAPGLFAGAGHGLLRVAHALRALGREDTAVRRRELAFGLGYWAGRFQRLPGDPGARPERSAAAALRAIVPVPLDRRKPGLFFEAVRVLDDDAGFRGAIASADLQASDPDRMIGALCLEGAQLYLANPHARIAYAHAVTIPSALRLMAPYVDRDVLRSLTGYAFQAVAALHAVSAVPADVPPARSPEVQALGDDVDAIRYRAACSLREHAIKLTEACLREDAIAPDPRLRLAAADAAVELEGREFARDC